MENNYFEGFFSRTFHESPSAIGKNILLKIFCTLLSFFSVPVDFKELFARARNLG